MPRKCAICDGDASTEVIRRLPLTLEELGLFDKYDAHPSCIIAMGSLYRKMAKRRGITLEQLVVSQSR